MPKVGKKHFPYTPRGKADAERERLVEAMDRAQKESELLRKNDLMNRSGWETRRLRRAQGLRPVPGRAPYHPHPNPPPKGWRPPKKNFPVRGTPPRVGKTPPKPPRKNPYQESDR